VDAKNEVRDFLTSRRAKITPAEAGLTSYGARRVPGLRREEVATLAGVSVDYYNRMERGNLAGASEGVLEAVAGALRLDEAERAHLFGLARASRDRSAGRRRGPARRTVRPGIQWMIDAMTGGAAFVVNGRQDILAANQLGRALFAPLFEAAAPANTARFTYLDPRARDFHSDWNRMARECVAALRTQAGRDPSDRGLSSLVGELSTRSEEFAALWATHNVRLHLTAEKRFRHPVVGELTLRYERLAVTADPGLEVSPTWRSPGHGPRRHSVSWRAGRPRPERVPAGEALLNGYLGAGPGDGAALGGIHRDVRTGVAVHVHREAAPRRETLDRVQRRPGGQARRGVVGPVGRGRVRARVRRHRAPDPGDHRTDLRGRDVHGGQVRVVDGVVQDAVGVVDLAHRARRIGAALRAGRVRRRGVTRAGLDLRSAAGQGREDSCGHGPHAHLHVRQTPETVRPVPGHRQHTGNAQVRSKGSG
jgi:transcriptional regulator with XRE-family HTH domain